MKKISLIAALLILLLAGCRPDACKDLPDGIYYTPALPADHQLTSDEVYAWRDLPKSIAKCISTDGLVQSILIYPEIGLIFAGFTSQDGYELVKSHYRGLGELESRSDRGSSLLRVFQDYDPLGFDKTWDEVTIGHYLVNEIYIQIIYSQYINLQNLGPADFKSMLSRSLQVYDLENSSPDYYGLFGLTFCTAADARMMLVRNYEPFLSLHNSNSWVRELTDFYSPCPAYLIDSVHGMAQTFLSKLK